MRRQIKGRLRFVFVAGSALLWCSALQAQIQRQNPMQNSDLSRENQSRVAAAAADIKTILVKDIGLMVELKRWVAKEATNHGQIITDHDLSDETIFDRLQSDVQFRSVATALVQRYGYFVPQLNPDSEAAKEQDLLAKERAKWMAQSQEQQATLDHQRNEQRMERAEYCAQRNEADCESQGNQNLGQPAGRQDQRDQGPQNQMGPGQSNPSIPSRVGGGQIERAQFSPEDELEGGVSELPLGNSAQSLAMLEGAGGEGLGGGSIGGGRGGAGGGSAGLSGGAGGGDSSAFMSRGLDGQSGTMLPISTPQGRNVVDALAAYGVGNSRPTPVIPEGTRGSRRDDGNASYGSYGSANSMTAFNRGARPRPAPPVPELVRAANPYNEIPSLYDMYVQAIPKPTTPKRFGWEVFENGTRDSQLIPMDLPAGPDYVVGPGDGLSIDLWGGMSTRVFRVVDREGRVSLPEVGPVLVSGKSLSDVQQALQQALRTQFRAVSADVSLGKLRTIRVYEVGDIANPGAYDISSLSTPLNALFVAGGPTQRGSLVS